MSATSPSADLYGELRINVSINETLRYWFRTNVAAGYVRTIAVGWLLAALGVGQLTITTAPLAPA